MVYWPNINGFIAQNPTFVQSSHRVYDVGFYGCVKTTGGCF
jgi:hypothetical protein